MFVNDNFTDVAEFGINFVANLCYSYIMEMLWRKERDEWVNLLVI